MRTSLICAALATLLCIAGSNARAEGTSALHEAAIDGDIQQLESLIASGEDINAADDDNDCTALHYAAIYGHEEVATLLLSHGADANAKGHWNDDTPLHDAAAYDQVGVATILLANGADVDAKNEGGWTPLHKAAASNHTDVIEVLLDHGAQVDSRGSWGETPLLVAADEDQLDAARVLVARGADVNIQGTKYRYACAPLHIAIGIGDYDLVELLVTHGADLTLLDDDGSSPLHIASWSLNKDIVELLIAHGADVHEKDGYGGTPLRYAAQSGYVPVAEVLLQAGADVDGDGEARSPAVAAMLADHRTMVEFLVARGAQVTIHLAAYLEDVNQVQALIDGGADLNAGVGSIGTPLLMAASAGSSEIVRLLIAGGADLEATRGSEARTPLHEAIWGGHADAAVVLMDAGADLYREAGWRGSPLEMAISLGHDDIAMRLIEHGVEPTIFQAVQLGDLERVKRFIDTGTNVNQGDGYSTILHAAAVHGHADVAEFLLAHGAEVDARTTGYYGQDTPLHYAARYGHKEVAEVLLSHGADVNARETWWGNTPLHYAATYHYLDMAELLLARGANVNSQEIDGRTPLHEAAQLGFADMVELLLAHGADVNVGAGGAGEAGMTPLHEAVLRGHTEVVRRLIAVGADVNATYASEHYTALSDAFDMGYADIMGLLGGDPNDPALVGRGPYSIIVTNPQKVRQFLSWEGIHSDEAWIPQTVDLDGLDASLGSYLSEQLGATSVIGPLVDSGFVLANLRRYNREYSGFYRGGSRYIICNMFLFWGIEGSFYVSEYAGPSGNDFTVIYDGGCGIVRVIFDAQTKTVVSIDCNGEA